MTIQSFFGSRVLHGKILQIALPMLLANLSTPLLGLVDTAILGHLNSPIYLGSVALGAQLITLIFWSFGFLRMGTTGFTSRSLGAGTLEEVKAILIRGLFFGLSISVFILLTQPFCLPFLVDLVVQDADINAQALLYAEIRIWSAPATLATYALLGWLIGIQKTRAPMIVLVSLNLLNIALDYLLIVKLDMRAEGAAWASLISEYVGCGLAVVFTFIAAKQLGINFRPWPRIDLRSYTDLFRSSHHLFVRTLCLLFCFLFFSAKGAELGENLLAANAILLNLLAITAYAMDGFAYTAETLGGQAWGARDKARLRQVINHTWIWAMGVSLLCCLVLVLGKPWILDIYTDLPSVRSAASQYYLWLALLPLLAIHSYQLDGIFIGVGETRAMRNAMLASCFLIFLPVWFALENLGNQGLWLAFWAFHIARTLFLIPGFQKICHTQWC